MLCMVLVIIQEEREVNNMYRFIQEHYSDRLIKDDEIIRIEKEFNVKFPTILREYYQYFNGAKIKLCQFEIDGYEYEISELVPLKYGYCCLERVKENDLQDGIIEENLFPIANNRGGDYYYWDKNTERIYLIYCDNIEEPIQICGSIQGLFELMSNSCN